MKKVFHATLAVLFMSALCFAAEPKAMITAQDKVEPLAVVTLDTEGSQGKNFYWRIVPSDSGAFFKTFIEYLGQDDKQVAILKNTALFQSPKPGTYYILFMATEDNVTSIAEHKLVVSGIVPTPDVPTPDKPDVPTPNLPDVTLPDIVTPNADWQASLQPIIASFVGPDAGKDSLKLSLFYLSIADIIERDAINQKLKDTATLRQYNIDSGALRFQGTDMKNKYPQLAQYIDEFLQQRVGTEIVPLTADKRQAVVYAFKAIAWACLESYKKSGYKVSYLDYEKSSLQASVAADLALNLANTEVVPDKKPPIPLPDYGQQANRRR